MMNISLKTNADHVVKMKDGMVKNVFVGQDSIQLKVSVEHVTQIPIIMEGIVSVIMDILETLINVINAMKLVENVLDQKQVSVLLVLMLVLILWMDIVKETLLAQLVFIMMENNVSLALLIALNANQKVSAKLVLKDLT